MARILTSFCLIASLSCASFGTGETPRIIDGRCTLHNELLIDQTLPIAYGLPHFKDNYYELREKFFPNYQPFVLGGCLVMPANPKEETVKICPVCKEAYERLKEQHQI
jgi:hypothetical protein